MVGLDYNGKNGAVLSVKKSFWICWIEIDDVNFESTVLFETVWMMKWMMKWMNSDPKHQTFE